MKLSSKNIPLYFLFLLEICFILFQTLNQSIQNDENEHLYNSYMVFKGLSPYSDFFEHHNPLMWYILAPFYLFFENNVGIYYFARFFMLVIILITAFYIYKISNLLKFSPFYCLLAVCFYFGFRITKETGIQIRPDSLMALFSIIAFYYLLIYIDKKNSNSLCFCFFYFCISFWVLQKAATLFLPVFIFLVISVITRKIKIFDVFFASFVPLLLSFIYLFYLYKTDTLNLYYISNYSGNFENTRIYDFFRKNSYRFTYGNIAIVSCFVLSFFALFLSMKNKEKMIKLISIYTLLCFFTIVHVTYAADRHYMLPILPFFSIINTYLLQKILKKENLKNLIIVLFIFYQITLDYIVKKETINPFQNYIAINKTITNTTDKDDEVMIHVSITGLKKQAEGYYYFGQQDIVKTVHNILPYKELPNKKEIIMKKRPKIIYDKLEIDEELLTFLKENYIYKIGYFTQAITK